jgi:hypothetical protein
MAMNKEKNESGYDSILFFIRFPDATHNTRRLDWSNNMIAYKLFSVLGLGNEDNELDDEN